MTEQKIDIKKQAGKNGKEYNNLNLKDIEYDNYIVVEKIYPAGMPFPSKFGGKTYSVGCKYQGELCSFWLNEKQHTAFQACGIVGDSVKVTAREERATNPKTKVTMLYKALDFVKV
jgi:hypothetical protein